MIKEKKIAVPATKMAQELMADSMSNSEYFYLLKHDTTSFIISASYCLFPTGLYISINIRFRSHGRVQIFLPFFVLILYYRSCISSSQVASFRSAFQPVRLCCVQMEATLGKSGQHYS